MFLTDEELKTKHEEIETELKRRKKERRQVGKPEQLKEIDLTSLREACQSYLDTVEDDGYLDNGEEHWIYETAIQAVFGKDVWKWINKQLKE